MVQPDRTDMTVPLKTILSQGQFFLKGCHPEGMDLKYIMNNMLHISILRGAQDYFTFINRAATFQYFGVPCQFSVLL